MFGTFTLVFLTVVELACASTATSAAGATVSTCSLGAHMGPRLAQPTSARLAQIANAIIPAEGSPSAPRVGQCMCVRG